MRFDPAADPWGTAMLAAAALWLLSLFVVVAATLVGTSRRMGARMMLMSLLVFLGAAAGGTWVRIQVADAIAARPVPPAPREIIAKTPGVDVDDGLAEAGSTGGAGELEGSTGGEPAAASTGDPAAASTGAAAGSTGEPAASTGEPHELAGDDGAEPERPPEPREPLEIPSITAPVVPEDIPQVDPLPSDPEERELAIRRAIEEAKRASGGGNRCGNLQRVAEAWAHLRLVPVSRRAKSVTADLERCRRRLLYSISQRRLGEQVEARDAFFDELPSRIRKEHGLIVQASISGVAHNRLRVGNRELDEAKADALMAAGLLEELTRLEFAHVVMSTGKTSKTYEIPVTPTSELGLPWLRAVGLGEPLKLVE